MNKAELLADFRRLRADIEALPDSGSVLFCAQTRLAISIPEGEGGHIAGLKWARIFSDAERRAGAKTFGLDRLYSDGNGRNFLLTEIKVAKRAVLKGLDETILTVEQAEG